MTSFSRPDLIACPYCGAKHERVMLRSFNDFWAIYYSDGGSSFAPYHFSGMISRCTLCDRIIAKTYNLPSAGEVVSRKVFRPSFWRKLFGLGYEYDVVKPFECPRLPVPELPDWVAAIGQFDLPAELREHAEWIFMWEYNQLLAADRQWQHKHFVWKDKYRTKHKQIEDKLLARLKASKRDSDHLLCADILRRRGQFEEALWHLDKVGYDSNLNLKRHLTQWVKENNTILMAIPNRGEADYDENLN